MAAGRLPLNLHMVVYIACMLSEYLNNSQGPNSIFISQSVIHSYIVLIFLGELCYELLLYLVYKRANLPRILSSLKVITTRSVFNILYLIEILLTSPKFA